jgi:hypothetical protein
MATGMGEIDLLGMDDAKTTASTSLNQQSGYPVFGGLPKERLEKPFEEENTLDEPVTVTIVGFS